MERKPVNLWHLTRRLGLLWVALPLILALVFGWVGAALWSTSVVMAREGVQVQGFVIDKQAERRRDSNGNISINYFITYAYAPERQTQIIEKRVGVTQKMYRSAEPGGPIMVTYAWSQPDRASLDPKSDRFGAVIFSTFAAIAALVTLGLGWWMIGRKVSAIRALRSGEVREARVTALRHTHVTKNRVAQYVLDWVDATGQKGTSLMASAEKLANYPTGSVIVIYVDPKTGRGWWDAQI
jgi:hypothetical protein